MKITPLCGINPYTNHNYSSNNAKLRFRGVKNSVINSSAGIFSELTQNCLKNLYKNLTEIQSLFLIFAHYPGKAIAIKEGYSGLLQKNRNQGLSFALPDKNGSIIIRPLRSYDNMLRLVVEDNNKVTSFLIQDTTKSVANVNQKNPQFLPRKFRYMSDREIKDSNIEKYIQLADEEISKYNDYLNQYRNPEKVHELEVKRSIPSKKIPSAKIDAVPAKKPVHRNIIPTVEDIKDFSKSITAIFEKPINEFPPNMIPEINKLNKIKKITKQTKEGLTLSLEKMIDLHFGNKLLYLKMTELTQTGASKSFAIDLSSYKFLKMAKEGRPLVRNNAVYEYNDADLVRNNIYEKMQLYKEEFLKVQDNPQPQKTIIQQAEIKEKITETQEPATEQDKDFEKLKLSAIAKAREDAAILSDIYFNEFKERFIENIRKRIDEFKPKFEKIFFPEN